MVRKRKLRLMMTTEITATNRAEKAVWQKIQ